MPLEGYYSRVGCVTAFKDKNPSAGLLESYELGPSDSQEDGTLSTDEITLCKEDEDQGSIFLEGGDDPSTIVVNGNADRRSPYIRQ